MSNNLEESFKFPLTDYEFFIYDEVVNGILYKKWKLEDITKHITNTLIASIEELSYEEISDALQKLLIAIALTLNDFNSAASADFLHMKRTTLMMMRQRFNFQKLDKFVRYRKLMYERCPTCNQVVKKIRVRRRFVNTNESSQN